MQTNMKGQGRKGGAVLTVIMVLLLVGCRTQLVQPSSSIITLESEKPIDVRYKYPPREDYEEFPAPEEEPEEIGNTFPEAYSIEGFPLILQMPELPTGCEVTALAMVLDYWNISVDKVDLAVNYLPTLPNVDLWYGPGDRLYGNDMNQYFIGDPRTTDGIICGPAAIVRTASSYLAKHGAKLQAEDHSGIDLDTLYQIVSEGIPVVVWCTIEMTERDVVEGWYTSVGEYVDWGHSDHAAVLVGFDPVNVLVADPLLGIAQYSRTQFERAFASRGNQCVVLY